MSGMYFAVARNRMEVAVLVRGVPEEDDEDEDDEQEQGEDEEEGEEDDGKGYSE